MPATWLADRIDDPTAAGIAAGVARLIRDGDLAPGARLPTVRALAPLLHVSPATVSTAWSTLRSRRAVRGEGRQGTWVIGPPEAPRPVRYDGLGAYWGTTPIDLTLAAPDPDLLPDPAPALAAALPTQRLASYDRSPITDALRDAVAPTWPWEPEAWLAVNGGYEGVQLALQGAAARGDAVAVEEPATPRTLDILDWLGVRRVPVRTDEAGPVPSSLERALRRGPVAFVYEPRAGSGTGWAVTPERAQQLAEVLAPTSTLVVEDDGVGDVASATYAGVGALLPDRSVLVRSYSKSHGPDLRIAVLAGARGPVEAALAARSYGSGWTSRLLQDALAWMLTDPASQAMVGRARQTYRERREDMVGRLRALGVDVPNRDGLALWVPVRDETQALMVLASHGIAAIPGSRFSTRPGPAAVRVTVGLPLADPQRVAEALALASRVG